MGHKRESPISSSGLSKSWWDEMTGILLPTNHTRLITTYLALLPWRGVGKRDGYTYITSIAVWLGIARIQKLKSSHWLWPYARYDFSQWIHWILYHIGTIQSKSKLVARGPDQPKFGRILVLYDLSAAYTNMKCIVIFQTYIHLFCCDIIVTLPYVQFYKLTTDIRFV